MRSIKLVMAAAASLAIVGCQQSQQVAEPEPQQPVVETGTCDFGAKASQRGIVTTRNDCNLRGGSFTPAAMTAPEAAPAAADTGLVDSSNTAVQTI